MGSRHPARARSGATLHLVPNDDRDGTDVVGTGSEEASDSRSFRRYPLWRVLSLNSLTVVHHVVGCAAILSAYHAYPIVGFPVGLAYLVFAMVQLYVLMPLVVCPGCVYRMARDGRCPSGLNLISARLCPPSASAIEFRQRSRGALCQSRLSLWSWIAPVPLALVGLAVSFSWMAVTLIATVAVLTVARPIIVRFAMCPHCLARRWCPSARARFS